MNSLFLYKDTNLVNYSTWIAGTTGSTAGSGPSPSFWNQYTVNETLNERVLETDPWGSQSVCWKVVSGNTQFGKGTIYGGFNMVAAAASYQVVPIDKTKTYRFSCWIKRKNIEALKGRFYFGIWATSGTTRNTIIATPTYTTTNNPYPITTIEAQTNDIFPDNEWRLCVAHLRPFGTPTGTTLHTDTGVYKPDGTKLTAGMTLTDYIMITDTYNVGIRASSLYNYPSGGTASGYALYPRIDLVDGTEPSIATLLNSEKDNKLQISNVAAQKIILGPRYYNLTLSYDASHSQTSCVSSQNTYYCNSNTFSSTTAIYTDYDCTVFPAAGYYSNQVIYKYWNGSSFTSTGDCVAP